ncbi:hypothetical protein [Streptomyces yangpuensis]|uniref:hypothetical protein n=1 Tax=Streptomyces yangpuensis TaxID=1648182 RepID=UPI00382CAF53
MRFSTGSLAYDLSLPRVRERFTPVVGPADWRVAECLVREAAAVLVLRGGRKGPGVWRPWATPGRGLARRGVVREWLSAAAGAFE